MEFDTLCEQVKAATPPNPRRPGLWHSTHAMPPRKTRPTTPEDWAPAFYDETDDCFYTVAVYEGDGHDLIYEIVALSPLATAHERLEHRPELFDVILEAQEAQEAGTVYHPERGFPARESGDVPADLIAMFT